MNICGKSRKTSFCHEIEWTVGDGIGSTGSIFFNDSSG